MRRFVLAACLAAAVAGNASAGKLGDTATPGAGDTFRDCGNCPEMVVVPPGSFRMGDLGGGGFSVENPDHTVDIAYTFAVGKYEVTRGEFTAFVRESGHTTDGACNHYTGSEWKKSASVTWRDPGYRQTDRHPVVCVEWTDAKAFAAWLSRKTGRTYRLLSEAEWEYVARAGSTSKYPFGNAEEALCAHGNGADESTGFPWRNTACSDGYSRQTAPVGSFEPTAFGVHDTLGNVWEWVEDCWHARYDGAPTMGEAWTGGGDCSRRVLRGGSWTNAPGVLRSANRGKLLTDDRYFMLGFRVVRELD